MIFEGSKETGLKVRDVTDLKVDKDPETGSCKTGPGYWCNGLPLLKAGS